MVDRAKDLVAWWLAQYRLSRLSGCQASFSFLRLLLTHQMVRLVQMMVKINGLAQPIAPQWVSRMNKDEKQRDKTIVAGGRNLPTP